MTEYISSEGREPLGWTVVVNSFSGLREESGVLGLEARSGRSDEERGCCHPDTCGGPAQG